MMVLAYALGVLSGARFIMALWIVWFILIVLPDFDL